MASRDYKAVWPCVASCTTLVSAVATADTSSAWTSHRQRTQPQPAGYMLSAGRKQLTETIICFRPTSFQPLASKRLMISPTRPRCTPSGLIIRKVRSSCRRRARTAF